MKTRNASIFRPRSGRALAAAGLASLFLAGAACAGGVSLQLARSTLVNVNDAAGTTQHEGGYVKKGSTVIGKYLVVRRVTPSATSSLNAAATTITLFLGATNQYAVENITLQGSHNFTVGNFKGGVSAASGRYTWLTGADATYTAVSGVPASNLLIQWGGSYYNTIP